MSQIHDLHATFTPSPQIGGPQPGDVSHVEGNARRAILQSSPAESAAPFLDTALSSPQTFGAQAEALAGRPLTGPAAPAARQAERLVETRKADQATLREFESLRDSAVNASPSSAPYFDALFRVLLLRPLTQELPGEGFAAPMDHVLNALFDRIQNSTDAVSMEQARAELRALRSVYAQEGALGAAQENAMDTLATLIEYKQGQTGMLDILEAETAVLEKGGRGDIQHLYDAASEAISRCRETGWDRPALGHLCLASCRQRAEKLTGRLFDASNSLTSQVRQGAGSVLARARAEKADPAELKQDVQALKAQAKRLAPSQLDEHRLECARLLLHSEGAVAVAELRQEIEPQLTSRSASHLEGLRGSIEEMKKRPLDGPEAVALGQLGQKLDSRIAQLRNEARVLEENFLSHITQGLEDASSPQDAAALRSRIAEHLAELSHAEKFPNLTAEQKADFTARLRDLDQQCYVREFSLDVDRAMSTKLDMPSLQECYERFQQAAPSMDSDRREQVEALFTEASASSLQTLLGRLDAMKAELASAGSESEVRELPVDAVFDGMERLLLNADRATCMDALGEVLLLQDDTQFALARDSFGITLNETQTGELKAVLSAGGFHPALQNVLRQAPELPSLLDELHGARESLLLGGSGAGQETLGRLDSLLLPHPELDGVLLDIKSGLIPESGQETLALRHTALCARRDIGRALDGVLDENAKARLGFDHARAGAVPTEVLQKMVDSLGAGKDSPLSQMDMALVRTLWMERKAEGMTFEDFSAGLPASFQKRAGLEQLIDSGLASTAALKGISANIRVLSRGFGGGRHLMEVCQRLASSDDRWAAATTLTRITRNLLGGQSFTGLQAMEGNASAVKRAIDQALHDTSFIGDRRDWVRTTFKLAEPEARMDFSRQLASFAQRSPALMVQLNEFRMREMAYEDACRAIGQDPVRLEMLDVIEEMRGPKAAEELRSNLGSASASGLKGATLAMGVHMLNGILGGEGFTLEERREAVKSLNFQNCVDTDQMEGAFHRSGLKNDEHFQKLVTGLCEARTDAEFEGLRAETLRYIDEKDMLRKADAVLYFKGFDSDSGTENVRQKMADAAHTVTKPLSPAVEERLASGISKRLAGSIGAGTRQGKSVGIAHELSAEVVAQRKQLARDARRLFSTQVLDTLDLAVDAAVCTAFLNQTGFDSVEELIQHMDSLHGGLENWSFYSDCKAQLAKLGIDGELGEFFLQQKLDALEADSFTALEEGTHTAPLLALRGLMLSIRTPGEVADLMRLDRFQRVSGELLETLDPGKTLSLNADYQLEVKVPVYAEGDTEVKLNVSEALQNGLSVWQNKDGTYHMTLMRTNKAGLGIDFEGFFGFLEGSAKVSLALGSGCDLAFKNREQCRQFMGAVLSGQLDPAQHLPLCDSIHKVDSGEIGAELSLGFDLLGVREALAGDEKVEGAAASVSAAEAEGEEDESWFSPSVGFELSASRGWRSSQDAEGVTYSATFQSEFNVNIGVTIAPESVTDQIEEGVEKFEDKTGVSLEDEADEAIEKNEQEFNLLSFAFEEERQVSTRHDGTLRSARNTRAFQLSGPDDAEKILKGFHVSPQCIADVKADVEKGGDFRLEIEHALPQSAVDALNARRDRTPSAKEFRLSEVRVVMESASASRSVGFDKGVVSFSRTMSGSATQTMRYSPVSSREL